MKNTKLNTQLDVETWLGKMLTFENKKYDAHKMKSPECSVVTIHCDAFVLLSQLLSLR